MKTVKVIGSGPLAGKVWYADVHAVTRARTVRLQLDGPGIGPGSNRPLACFDLDSGGMLFDGAVTDLMFIPPADRALLEQAAEVGGPELGVYLG